MVSKILGRGYDFVSINEDRVNLLGLYIAGVPGGALYLWDHYAISSALSLQLTEMHRFDASTAQLDTPASGTVG